MAEKMAGSLEASTMQAARSCKGCVQTVLLMGIRPRLALASCLHSAAQRRPNTRAQTLHNTRVRAIPGRHNIVSTGTVNGVLDDFLVNVSAGSREVRGTVVLHCARRCSRPRVRLLAIGGLPKIFHWTSESSS